MRPIVFCKELMYLSKILSGTNLEIYSLIKDQLPVCTNYTDVIMTIIFDDINIR